MESYLIAFSLGFLIDKMSLFPFVVGFGLGTIVNNKNWSKYYIITKEFCNQYSTKLLNDDDKKI
tara:strand:- start:319 stop:510 length:192 start_codon:yes stop_codon:yes gene_type:complete